jgi:hypothetical protein
MNSVGSDSKKTEAKKCKTCSHANPKANTDMAKQGFALCNLGPKWEFHAPTFTCNKWSAKT